MEAKKKLNILDTLKSGSGTIVAMVVMIILLFTFTDTFATKLNFCNLLKQINMNALLAMGMTCCLITGFVDLSVGSHVALATVEMVVLWNMGLPLIVCITIVVLVGIFIGFINGFIFSRTEMPAYIVTLGMQNVLRGIAYVWTNGGAITVQNDGKQVFFNYANSSIGGWVPWSIFIVIVVFIIIKILLSRTVFGRHMYATGGNKDTAVYSGIDVKNIRLIVYMISGALAALAGTIAASRVYSGQPSTGIGFEGEAIASCVLGGVSFNGGKGKVTGTLMGIVIMGIMSNGMNLLEISYYWQLVVKGAIIIVAVYSDLVKRSKVK